MDHADELAFKLFRRLAYRVFDSRVLDDGLSVSICLAPTRGLRKTEMPDQEDLIAFATGMRQLISPGEPGSFKAAHSRLGKHVTSAHGRQLLRTIKNKWKSAFKDERVTVRARTDSGHYVLDANFVLSHWFNGEVFHSDPDKVALMEEFRKDPVIWDPFQARLVLVFMDLLDPLWNLAQLVEFVLRESREPEIIFIDTPNGLVRVHLADGEGSYWNEPVPANAIRLIAIPITEA